MVFERGNGGMRILLRTLGCALNRGDSLVIRDSLERAGHSFVDDPHQADVIIVNTCAVRSDSEQKSLKLISRLTSENPKAKLIVTGCLAEVSPYSILRLFPEASLISPYRVGEVVHVLDNGQRLLLGYSSEKRELMPISVMGAIAILPINDGCLGNCSFCVTKKARRILSSKPPSLVLHSIRDAVKKGAREIQLASQDAGAYGVDLAGKKLLPELIEAVDREVPGKYMIRIAMMNPDTIRDIIWEVVDMYRSEHVFKFAHIPLQSADDSVLKLMNRRYTLQDFMGLVGILKREIPGITIATDILIGHPGEDDAAFKKTLEIVKSGLLDRVHIAQYTQRPFTYSSRMQQVSDGEKKSRSKLLAEVHSKVALEKMKSYIGREIEGFIVERSTTKQTLTVRSKNYTSIVVPDTGEYALGDEVVVRVEEATHFDLRGVIERKVE
ncbi:MAG: tRNA (N(6)-L-threonylcarbamoyladenosine(37)-C(2))-methylthiotransferase [Fervidicoccaceae archaeon]